MNDYLEKGKDVLNILTNSGYQAYLIGGVVRNTILGIDFDEIDITTSATPDLIRKCFINAKVEQVDDGCVRLFYAGYEFVISTFKSPKDEIKKNKNVRTHYSKVLEDDLASRDFTINAIAMSYGGKLTDAFNGYPDLNKKLIRAIGSSPKLRFNDDPIKMLRAVRLVSQLGFKIEKHTLRAMKSRAKAARKLDVEKILIEIYKLLNGKYLKKAIEYIIYTKLYRYIPVFGRAFKRLLGKYKQIDVDTFLEVAFVLNKSIDETALKLSENPAVVKQVFNLATVSPKSKYNVLLLYSYGLDVCLQANKVMYLLGKSKLYKRKITSRYNALPIKSVCDLAFKGEDLLHLTNSNSTEYIQKIVDQMVYKVLNKELPNDREHLKIYALELLKDKDLLQMHNDSQNQNDTLKENASPAYFAQTNYNNEQVLVNNIDNEYNIPVNNIDNEYQAEYNVNSPLNNHLYQDNKIQQFERRMNEQDEILRKKDEMILELRKQSLKQKLEQDVIVLSDNSASLIKDLGYLDNDLEVISIKRELKAVYRKVLINMSPEYKILKEDRNEEN